MTKSEINLKSNKKISIETLDSERSIALRQQIAGSDFYQYAFSGNVKPIHSERTIQFQAYVDCPSQPMGYMQIYKTKDPSVLWIQSIAIAKDHLRQGFGSSFYHEAIDQMNQDGQLKKIILSCHKANHTGLHFWKKLGFSVDEVLTKKQDAALIMSLEVR